MAAPKGHARYGGRKAGTPNKKTQALVDAIAAAGKDPLRVMLDLLSSDKEEIKLSAARELLQYMYPKRKAMEVSGPDGAAVGVEVSDEDKAKIANEVRAEIKNERRK